MDNNINAFIKASIIQATSMFLRLWETLPTMEFDPSWNNTTGYLNGAIYVRGEGAHSFTTEDGRKGILVSGTRRSFVFFERCVGGYISYNARKDIFGAEMMAEGMLLVSEMISQNVRKETIALHINTLYIACSNQELIQGGIERARECLEDCGFSVVD